MILDRNFGPTGIIPANRDALVRVRGASFEKGDVVQFNLSLSDDDVNNNVLGDPASGFFNVTAPTSGGVAAAILAVLLEDVADDGIGVARIQGIVDEAYVIKASGSIAAGDPLVATIAGDLDGTPAAGERYIAYALEAAATPTTHTRIRVAFDGMYGFATFVS